MRVSNASLGGCGSPGQRRTGFDQTFVQDWYSFAVGNDTSTHNDYAFDRERDRFRTPGPEAPGTRLT